MDYRIKNLENYYNKIYNSFTEPNSKSEGWISKSISWWYGNKEQTKPQLCIEQATNEESEGEESEGEDSEYLSASESFEEEEEEEEEKINYNFWERSLDNEYLKNYNHMLS